ncbi:hypothetical protein HDF23_002742 [Mucilaginibacter lappiensis]|uniref:Uncharacterized protein n=1 Tax=Mucilaginibacter lappiensis TaxID=354630 RepID=A0ABR6PK18_9SPHI|nr:hypothetical protein [Mucilaginibacter lappiensis]
MDTRYNRQDIGRYQTGATPSQQSIDHYFPMS